MQTLTTTIRRQPLEEILSGEKKIEYREIKKYWEDRLAKYKTPFLLRLINGMAKSAPEITVRVEKVRRNTRHGDFELHLGKIVDVKNCESLKRGSESRRQS